MPKFIRLATLTEQGTRNVKNLGQMLQEAKQVMKESGVTFETAYTTLGPYDIVAIIDAPDAAAASKASALIAAKGNFRAQTLAAIPIEEFISLMT